MKEKRYVIEDMCETGTFRLTSETALRIMLKDFEFNYIRDRIYDIKSDSDHASATAQYESIFNAIDELNGFIQGYYKSIDTKSLKEICQILENNYDIVIYELGDSVNVKVAPAAPKKEEDNDLPKITKDINNDGSISYTFDGDISDLFKLLSQGE